MRGKRGQDLTLTSLILVVLGVVIFAVLIFGITMGWSNFWNMINPFDTSNVDSVEAACELACASERSDDFCKDLKTVKFGGEVPTKDEDVKTKKVTATCDQLSQKTFNADIGGETVDIDVAGYINVGSCSEIHC